MTGLPYYPLSSLLGVVVDFLLHDQRALHETTNGGDEISHCYFPLFENAFSTSCLPMRETLMEPSPRTVSESTRTDGIFFLACAGVMGLAILTLNISDASVSAILSQPSAHLSLPLDRVMW